MFCLSVPCVCDGKKPKKPTVKRKLPAEEPPAQGGDMGWNPGANTPRAFFGRKKLNTDEAFQPAVEILAAAGMLHPDTLAENKDLLEPHPPPEVRTRLTEWRQRGAS